MTLSEWFGSDKTITAQDIRKMASKLGIEEFNEFISEHDYATRLGYFQVELKCEAIVNMYIAKFGIDEEV